MRPPALSWWWLLLSLPVLTTGMLCLAGADARAALRSSSESLLLLELSSLLEDEELLESEELSPLLSWSMTRASAINSAHAKPEKRSRGTGGNQSTGTKITDPGGTSLNVIHGGRWRRLLSGRGTLGAGEGLAAAAALHLLAKTTGLLLQSRVDLAATFSPGNEQFENKEQIRKRLLLSAIKRTAFRYHHKNCMVALS